MKIRLAYRSIEKWSWMNSLDSFRRNLPVVVSDLAHPGFRGAGSGVRRPGRRLRRQEELFPSCVYYRRTERTQDRWGAFLARYRDEAVARSAAAILPSY